MYPFYFIVQTFIQKKKSRTVQNWKHWGETLTVKAIMVRKFEFHPRYKVEVSMYGSWFPATIIRRVSSNKFFVKYDHLNVRPAVVGVHQLRPVPRTVRDWEVKIGDKVEAFGKQRWREGHVSEVIGSTGKLFSVRFNDWKEMIVSKEKRRVHRKWINHNWVPRITNQQLKNNSKVFLFFFLFFFFKIVIIYQSGKSCFDSYVILVLK